MHTAFVQGIFGGVVTSLLFSFIIVTGLVPDLVSFVDMDNVNVAISKCPDQQYVNLTIIGRPNSYHKETKITCLDGSVVTVKIK